MKIGIDSLSEIVAQELSNYSRGVNKTLRDEVKTTTKQCVKDIRRAGHQRFNMKVKMISGQLYMQREQEQA